MTEKYDTRRRHDYQVNILVRSDYKGYRPDAQYTKKYRLDTKTHTRTGLKANQKIKFNEKYGIKQSYGTILGESIRSSYSMELLCKLGRLLVS